MAGERRRHELAWLRHIDAIILLVVAAVGVFLGVAEVVFKVPALKERQIGLAIILLGALALHALLQRFTAYEYQDEIERISSKLDDLLSLDGARRTFLRAMGHFIEVQDLKFKLRARGNPAYGEVSDSLLRPSFEVLESLAQGHVNVPDNLVVTALTLLLGASKVRFDAVSNDDINFWHDDKTIAPRYLRQNMSAIRRKLIVTRIFIVTRRQLMDAAERRRLVRVLRYQRFVGIAWALAIFEDLEPSLPPGPLDFALFDGDRVVSSFRREGERRFIATFNTEKLIPANDERVQMQVRLYEALLAEIWASTEEFEKVFLGRSEQLIERLKIETSFYNQRLRDATGLEVDHDVFPFIIKSTDDVAVRVATLADAYQKYQATKAEQEAESAPSNFTPPPVTGQ